MSIGVPHFGGLAPTEHDVEFREPEHERIVLVDEGDVHLVGDRFGQPGHQLEATETSSEDDDVFGHGGRVTARSVDFSGRAGCRHGAGVGRLLRSF